MSNTKRQAPKDLNEVAAEWRQVERAQSVQMMLWSMFYAAMASPETSGWGPVTRGNMMFLYQRLHNLVHDLDPENSLGKIETIDDWHK